MRHALAVVTSEIESWNMRLTHRLKPRVQHDHVRGATCPLCKHQLGAADTKPPRDVRTPAGQMRRLPAELLEWRRCGGCGLYQEGEIPTKSERAF